jgi:hypothetical protein
VTRTERSAAQEHFLDLCDLLIVPKPAEVDRHGTEYTFEKSTRKIGDTQGFADAWWRGRFAWEYKVARRNLVEAYAQLKQYADALENPPLLTGQLSTPKSSASGGTSTNTARQLALGSRRLKRHSLSGL